MEDWRQAQNARKSIYFMFFVDSSIAPVEIWGKCMKQSSAKVSGNRSENKGGYSRYKREL